MLDLIEEGAFVATGSGRLQPVSKAAVFREFMAPLDPQDEIPARDAEVAPRLPCRTGDGGGGRRPDHRTDQLLERRAAFLTDWRTWNVQRSGNN
jgi:hypothetical protein